MNESKKLDHLIFFFFNFTHKGWKYLTIIEHIFYFIIPFSCQNLSSIHAFVLHTNGLQVDADYIPELGFSSRDLLSKYHNLYSTTLSYAIYFQNSLHMVAIDKFDCIHFSAVLWSIVLNHISGVMVNMLPSSRTWV